MIEAKAEDYGVCCTSCQENVNVHGCGECNKSFEDRDVIYCKHHHIYDCEHYHEQCKEE